MRSRIIGYGLLAVITAAVPAALLLTPIWMEHSLLSDVVGFIPAMTVFICLVVATHTLLRVRGHRSLWGYVGSAGLIGFTVTWLTLFLEDHPQFLGRGGGFVPSGPAYSLEDYVLTTYGAVLLGVLLSLAGVLFWGVT